MSGAVSVRVLVDDVEEARFDRLREACDKKFGKLAEWKRSYDAHTVLVLEDADIQLTNELLVGDALARAEEGRTDKPDEIYLVSTHTDSSWWVTCLRRPGKSHYDDESYWEIRFKNTEAVDGPVSVWVRDCRSGGCRG